MKDAGDIATQAGAVADIPAVLAAVAAELDASRQCLEQLGLRLCTDPDLAQAHLPALQGLDELGQRQACLAQLLRAADMRAAIAAIPLDSLRARLTDRLDAAA